MPTLSSRQPIWNDDITLKYRAVHDAGNRILATMLAEMEPPDLPVAMGVLYQAEAEPYERSVVDQIEAAKAASTKPDLNALLRSGSTWTV